MDVYAYRPKRRVFATATLILGVCAWAMTYMALEGSATLEMPWDLVDLGPERSRIAFGGFALFFAFCATLCLWMVLLPQKNAQPIRLGETAVSLPKRAGGAQSITIPYSQILDLRVIQVAGQRYLELRHTTGRVTILGMAVRGRGNYDRLIAALKARVAQTRP